MLQSDRSIAGALNLCGTAYDFPSRQNTKYNTLAILWPNLLDYGFYVILKTSDLHQLCWKFYIEPISLLNHIQYM